MKRAILAVLVAMFPMAASAQDAPAQPASGTDTAAAAPAASPSTDDAAMQPRMGPARTKRRGSMVGYIEDPTIGSGFRIRYDSGWDMTSPDRAEFFYGKCGCFRTLTGSPAQDTSAPGPGPGVVEAMNYNQLNMTTERQMGKRASIFFDLPFRWIKPTDFVTGTGSFDNQSGLGDISVGTKIAIATSASHDFTVMVRGSIPTGDSTKGLGTDHGSIEPALLVRQGLGSRLQIEGEFGGWHPTGSSKGPLPGDGNFAGNILYYGIGPSFDLVQTRNVRFAPVVELVGWHVLSGFQTSTFNPPATSGDASGINIVNLKFGARVTTSGGGSLYIGYGYALTDNTWYDHILRLEFRKKI
jgi:Putative MetA-pathway of phenol degradation